MVDLDPKKILPIIVGVIIGLVIYNKFIKGVIR